MKKFIIALTLAVLAMAGSAKTLIVYYSFTNNVHTIVTDLLTQIDADVVRIEPAEEGLDYAANNYAIGSALISAIQNNPNNPESYPEIKPVNVNLDEYDIVIVAAPLWWNHMAAPLQTYLFHNGPQMAGKKIGLIVSSASSGISVVEADARRLIPDGEFLTPSLRIRSYQTSSCHSLTSNWLDLIDYNEITNGVEAVTTITQPSVSVTPSAIHVEGEFDSFELYNLSGNKMLQSSDNVIDIKSLPQGIYVARINAQFQSSSKKIIIANNI